MQTTHEATELAIHGINTGALYQGRALPVIENLARKIARGTYDHARAPQAFAYWAEAAARSYSREYSTGADWSLMFKPAARLEAARIALKQYREQIEDRAADLKAEAENRKRWTLSAIKTANTKAGLYFFSRATMRFFGDSMASFAVRYDGPRIYIERVRPMHNANDTTPAGRIGARREFDPQTGAIGPADREEA